MRRSRPSLPWRPPLLEQSFRCAPRALLWNPEGAQFSGCKRERGPSSYLRRFGKRGGPGPWAAESAAPRSQPSAASWGGQARTWRLPLRLRLPSRSAGRGRPGRGGARREACAAGGGGGGRWERREARRVSGRTWESGRARARGQLWAAEDPAPRPARPREVMGPERLGEQESGEMASLGCSPHARWGFIRPGARGREDRLTCAPAAGLGPGLPAGTNDGLRDGTVFSWALLVASSPCNIGITPTGLFGGLHLLQKNVRVTLGTVGVWTFTHSGWVVLAPVFVKGDIEKNFNSLITRTDFRNTFQKFFQKRNTSPF